MVATNNGDSVTDPVISGSAADQRRLLWGPFSDMRCALDLDPKFVGAFDLHPVCSIPGNLGLVPGWLPITSRRPAEWSRCPFFPHLISHQVHQSSSKRRKKEKGLHLGSLADVARPRPSPRLLSESPRDHRGVALRPSASHWCHAPNSFRSSPIATTRLAWPHTLSGAPLAWSRFMMGSAACGTWRLGRSDTGGPAPGDLVAKYRAV